MARAAVLACSDYTVWFVDPRVKELLGHEVFPSLADPPGTPDIVDVFRRASETA